MIRFGGPVYFKDAENPGFKENYSVDAADPVALAKAHKAKDYSSAYAPAADVNDTARIADIIWRPYCMCACKRHKNEGTGYQRNT